MRGYRIQIWRSVLAWMDLGDKETLYLEGAEDIDRDRGGHSSEGRQGEYYLGVPRCARSYRQCVGASRTKPKTLDPVSLPNDVVHWYRAGRTLWGESWRAASLAQLSLFE
jgi:hypothetical protein